MIALVHVWFAADNVAEGIAGLAVGLVVHLYWLNSRQKRQRRQDQQKPEREC